MVLPDFVKSHPVISVFIVLIVAGVIGFAAYSYTEGTGFVDDQECAWTAFENPETGGNFTSKQQAKDYFQSHGKTIPANLTLRVENGTLYQQLPGGCGTVGGETS